MEIIIIILAVVWLYALIGSIIIHMNKQRNTKTNILGDIRCPDCSKLLLKASEDTRGTLSCWCARCKKEIVIVRAS